MQINFYPDNEDFSDAAKEYQFIWQQDGKNIINALQNASGMTFKKNIINAIIFETKSHSHPLTLRASYSLDVKKGTLIHELAHRLFVDNNHKAENSLEAHKLINHTLYSAWVTLYGKEFADTMVSIESDRAPVYKEAWNLYFKK
jgi:hypothetical protein